MSLLPIEIVQAILGSIYLPPDERAWSLPGFIGRRRWLAATLHVSRNWLAAGLPVLYRRIEISPYKNPKQTALLIRTFSKRRDLARLVHEIRFEQRPLFLGSPERYAKPKRVFCGIGGQAWAKPPQPRIPFTPTKREKAARARRVAMRKIAECCEHATILRFDAENTAHATEVLDAVDLLAQRIEVLEVYGSSRGVISHIMRVGPWPHLRVLALGSWNLWIDSEAGESLVTEFAKCFPQLTSLDIGNITNSVPSLYDMLKARGSTLRSLRCGFRFGSSQRLDFQRAEYLTVVQSGLTELSIACESTDILPNLASYTSLNLLEVVLRYRQRDHHDNTLWAGNTPVGAFPPLIETIKWIVSHVTSPKADSVVPRIQATFAAIDAGVLPCLKHVHLHFDVQKDTGLNAWTSLVSNLSHSASQRGVCFQFTVTILPANAEDEDDGFAQREIAMARRPIRCKEPSTLQLIGKVTLQCLNCLWGCICCISYVGCCCCFTARLCREVEEYSY